ncbi:MAG: T9SS type A sorting domain-containing protein, partial [candidate division Zixibacteria bacterium]|nr:T9SS type A sorting domain-containing protein [Candidatus Tariuqbacter arcticus]
MKKFFIVLTAVMLLSISVSAQPDTLWTQTYGGGNYDGGYSVRQTTDGGFVIAGTFDSDYGWDNGDVWLIKTDTNGDTVWTQTFGGAETNIGFCVQQTTDGGYIIVGDTYASGNRDVWLIKTNESGNLEWEQTFGGGNMDAARCVQQTEPDGGYIIVGYTWSFGAGNWDVWLIKTNANGDSLWSRTFGGSLLDTGHSVWQTTDGGYIIAGTTISFTPFGGSDVYLIKTDANGIEEWYRIFGVEGFDNGASVQQTTDGGYIIAGETHGLAVGTMDAWLIKTDANGNSSWTQTFSESDADEATSVQQTADGGYIMAGYTGTYASPSSYDYYIVKTDWDGIEEWHIILGGSNGDYARSVQQTSDGGYIIAGETYSYGAGGSDVWLIRLEGDSIIFEDDFSSGNLNNWTVLSGSWDVVNGEMWGHSDGATISPNIGMLTNYVFETDCRFEDGLAWGIDFRYIDPDNRIRLDFAPGAPNQLNVNIYENGSLVSSPYQGTITQFGTYYEQYYCKFIVDGIDFKVYFGNNPNNLTLLCDTTYEAFNSGTIRYHVWGYPPDISSYFDNVLITWYPPPPPPIIITLTPANPPIVIPETGGSFDFNIAVENTTSDPQTIDIWTQIVLPEVGWVIPINVSDFTIPETTLIDRDRTQLVPEEAPGGIYTYYACVGDYPWVVDNYDTFTFEKEGADGGWFGSASDWLCMGEPFTGGFATDNMPGNFALHTPYPNPFNPTTAISYQLPAASYVELTIYDIQGREAASLVDGFKPAGIYEVTFDGAGLSSGVYFA